MSNQLTKPAPSITACLQSERWKEELKKVLPTYLTPEMMLRVSMSIAKDPKFAACSPESFFLALIKCARAGLVPDGRNAHLIPFGQEVQAIFDWKGLVAMAKRNGVEVTAKLVFASDEFSVEEDDGQGRTRVIHRVDFRKSRGEILLVYSRARTTKNDDIDYEFMTAQEVENVRQSFSKAKDSLMWIKAWGEGAKKTVIRRHSKRWDLSPEDRAAINSDDDAMDTQPAVVFSKPLFEAKQIETKLEPEVPASSPADTVPEPLKLIRQALTAAQLPENKLLEFLFASGDTDGSHATLDEVPGEVLQRVFDKWAEVLTVLKGGGK